MSILMVYPALVTWIILMLYFWLTFNVGKARTKHQVKPPAVTGPEEFMRYFRVQQNTMEQTVLFLPMMWLFAFYISAPWAAVLGLGWVIARSVYAMGYYQESPKRMPGFLGGIIIVAITSVGAVIGIVRALMITS